MGVHCLRSARRRDRSALPLAAVPLFFGVQQALEGLVWIGLTRDEVALTQYAAVAYLFFASAFWLFWIPFSASALESRPRNKAFLRLLSVLGAAAGLYFYVPILMRPHELGVRVSQHSIYYDLSAAPGVPAVPPLVWHLSYLSIICLPLLLVARGRKALIAFSVVLVLSALLSHTFFLHAFASVWCFCAAILSLLLARMFHRLPLAPLIPASQQSQP